MTPEIIKKAKKVFSGVVFDVYQWEQEMFDGSTKTFEMAYRHGGVVIIATIGDKILVQTEKHPHWQSPKLTIPAGECDTEDTIPLEQAKCELEEETGYISDDWRLWRTTEIGGKVHWPIHVYIARNCRDTGKTNLDRGGEQIETRLVSFDEFLKTVQDPTFRIKEILPDCLHAYYDKEKYTEMKELFFSK